jgi:hypothetical protein
MNRSSMDWVRAVKYNMLLTAGLISNGKPQRISEYVRYPEPDSSCAFLWA